MDLQHLEAEVFVAIGFAIFLAILWRYRAPHIVVDALDSRIDKVKGELAEAQRLRSEAEALLASFEQKKAEAEAEARELSSFVGRQRANAANLVELKPDAIVAIGGRVIPVLMQLTRTIPIIIGYPPGGSYDIYARLAAAHMGKYISGHPGLIVQNKPGGIGVMRSFYETAPKDGSTIGIFPETIAIVQLTHPEIGKWSVQNLSYIGSLANVNAVFMVRGPSRFPGQFQAPLEGGIAKIGKRGAAGGVRGSRGRLGRGGLG
jgi:hypothetical protein